MKELDYKDLASLKSGVVCFGAAWCRDCRIAEPLIEKLAEKYPHIHFYHVDVDVYENARSELNIRHIPTIIYLKNGEEVAPRVVEPHSIELIEAGIKNL